MQMSSSLPCINNDVMSRDQYRRLLSANKVEFNNLISRRKELLQCMSELRRENKLLHTQQLQTGRALEEFESEDHDIPRAKAKHAKEIQSITDQLRKQLRQINKTERKLRKKEAELDKVQRELKHNKALIDDNKLPEADDLEECLSHTTAELTVRDLHIQELQNEVLRLNTTHKTAVERERHKQKEIQRESQMLEDRIKKVQMQIKNADRELANGEIYCQQNRRLSQPSTAAERTPVISHDIQHSSLSDQEILSVASLRQKMQQFDTQRREHWIQQLKKDERRKQRALNRAREQSAQQERDCSSVQEQLRHQEQENEKQQLKVETDIARMKQLEKDRLEQLKERELNLAMSMKKAEAEHEMKKKQECERIAMELKEQRNLKYEQLNKEAEAMFKRRNIYSDKSYMEAGEYNIKRFPSRKISKIESTVEGIAEVEGKEEENCLVKEKLILYGDVQKDLSNGDYEHQCSVDEQCNVICDVKLETENCFINNEQHSPPQRHRKKRSKKSAAAEAHKDYAFPQVVEHLHKGVPTISAGKQ